MTRNGHKGYRLEADTLTLKFEGEYEGLEVVCQGKRHVSLGTYLQFAKLADLATEEGVSQVHGMADYFEQFSREVLISWNLEDATGRAIPVHPDGMIRAPLDLAMVILSEWMKAVQSGPLVETSPALSTDSVSDGGLAPALS